jgi:hypothetical protein
VELANLAYRLHHCLSLGLNNREKIPLFCCIESFLAYYSSLSPPVDCFIFVNYYFFLLLQDSAMLSQQFLVQSGYAEYVPGCLSASVNVMKLFACHGLDCSLYVIYVAVSCVFILFLLFYLVNCFKFFYL